MITDGTPKFIRANLNRLINGVTLLTATAPALASLLQEADKTISFDRCAHLVLDSADLLFSNHMESMKILIPLYQASVKRINAAAAHFVPRQVFYPPLFKLVKQIFYNFFISLDCCFFFGMEQDHGLDNV